MAKSSPKRLGRGLDNLISGGGNKNEKGKASPVESRKKLEATAAKAASVLEDTEDSLGYRSVPVSSIRPNPFQPRKEFVESQIEELAKSISEEGLLQPIVVRKKDKHYELIAGERRLRAFQFLKKDKVPARIVEVSDGSSASLALIENLQREGLNPIEESLGYASLMRDFDMTQDAVSKKVGKGRATIANALRLLQLEKEIQGYLAKGHLSTGHAKALLSVQEPSKRLLLARKVVESGASVREVEKAVQGLRNDSDEPSSSQDAPKRKISPSEVAAVQDIEKSLKQHFKTSVTLKHAPKKGKIIIDYYGNDDLQRILEMIGIS